MSRPAAEAASGASSDLPADLLEPLCGPMVWTGKDFEHRDSYSLQLSQGEITEIEDAIKEFKTLGLDGDKVTRQNFALPTLEPRLFECANTVHSGRGFFVLRGLNTIKYSIEDSAIIFLGIASYIANQRGLQDGNGNVLALDSPHSEKTRDSFSICPGVCCNSLVAPFEPIVALTRKEPYHNDMGCDVLALQVRQAAKSGGHTYLSSAWTAYNQLLTEDPMAVRELLAPAWPVQISGRRSRHYLAPALALHDGKLMVSLDPGRLGPHPNSESKDIPNLTEAQMAALQKIADAAAKHELRLELDTGDIIFFNNWSLLHRRDSYVDGQRSSRHMVRLWLRNTELGWAVPESMAPPWQRAFGEEARSRRGIYSLVPMPEYKVPRYSAGSAAFVIEDSDMSDEDVESD